ADVTFTYNDQAVKNINTVTLKFTGKPLSFILQEIERQTPLAFRLQGNLIGVTRKQALPERMPVEHKIPIEPVGRITVSGTVTSQNGQPLTGVTVMIKETGKMTVTDQKGNYIIGADSNNTLIFSFVGFSRREIPINGRTEINIILSASNSPLDEVKVIAYGTTTQRLNTGSITTVSAKDIAEQPVTNVLSALSGRVPGMFVQTTNGLPGGNISIAIRGKGSITAGTAPLYIIDGVPFATTIGGSFTTSAGALASGSVNGAVSPLNSLNPDDIESITILKDADATAIYGSRGSNGVVLITTKKGHSGKTQFTINVNQGVEESADMPQMLNLQQYLQIRREAFANDGLTPSSDPTSATYAPDLTVWSNSKSTNWAKYLLGGTGHSTDAQANITGGNDNTSFMIGGNFHSESTYLPGDNLYQRGGIHFSLQHTSPNRKFYIQFSNSLTLDNNRLTNLTDDATDLTLSPNYPIYDASGNYNWFYANPFAEASAVSKANTMNTVDNVLAQYTILPELKVKISAGYSNITLDQTQIFPTEALYPGSINYTNFGNNGTRSFIAEPQITYDHRFKNSALNVLLGSTYQNTLAKGDEIQASNFSTESLMNNLGSAGSYTLLNSYTQYKYVSVFGRVTYNLEEKYILNATVRRDGSSRFGPGNQSGNFGSIGAAWLFGEENLVKKALPFLSYGKLRGSYGVTGNDQIPDYQYLSTYGSSGYIYQGISGLKPNRIANSDFHWESTRKVDVGL
ncbi:MAG: SusC/RagA family TonB-linked outer membrane protein, partial [Bacteroidetes bacterium]|nr:SusC/RagA family TonB-linked outer membrane protein [Bacteroidota bacterium]